MIIRTTKNFDKQYAKLDQKVKNQFKSRVELFKVSPYDPILRNHALKGNYLGYKSINVNGDVKALYTVEGDTVTIFAFVGTHSQLYR